MIDNQSQTFQDDIHLIKHSHIVTTIATKTSSSFQQDIGFMGNNCMVTIELTYLVTVIC